MDNEWIVSVIPSLHPSYAIQGADGYWRYWEKLEDGKWKWNPKWVTASMIQIMDYLDSLEKDWSDLEREECETSEEKKTTEWYQTISGRKLSLHTELEHYRELVKNL